MPMCLLSRARWLNAWLPEHQSLATYGNGALRSKHFHPV